MRKILTVMLYEIVFLALCIWFLEAIGYIDFIADATYSVELVTRRIHVTSMFSTFLVIFPPIIRWLDLTKLTKENTESQIAKVLNSMLMASIRGCIYALILSQWNISQLQQYVIHCSQ